MVRRRMPWVNRRVFSWMLLGTAALGVRPAKAQEDSRTGVSSGWSWLVTATTMVMGPPATAVRQVSGPPLAIQIDYHISDPARPQVLHHLKFAPDAPMPSSVELLFDGLQKGDYDLAETTSPEMIFLTEELPFKSALTVSQVDVTAYRVRYPDGVMAEYEVDTRLMRVAASDAALAWSDLGFGDEDCVLTSATCGLGRLPDDCFELSWARQLRDGWLSRRPVGPALIARYRREAPRLLRRLRGDPHGERRLARFYWTGALPAAVLGRLGRPRAAAGLYIRAYLRLSRAENLSGRVSEGRMEPAEV